MKAYSLDLRQKIVDAYTVGNISQRKLAKNFGVSLAFVQKLLKRHRELGKIAPKVRTEQTPTKLNCSELEVLRQLVEAQPDATLEELRTQLHHQTSILISVATVDRMVRLRLNLRFKKKVSTPPKKAVMKSNSPDSSTGNCSVGFRSPLELNSSCKKHPQKLISNLYIARFKIKFLGMSIRRFSSKERPLRHLI